MDLENTNLDKEDLYLLIERDNPTAKMARILLDEIEEDVSVNDGDPTQLATA